MATDDEDVVQHVDITTHGHAAVEVVDQWIRECVHGSVLARDTESYNHLMKQLEELKRRLAEECPQ